MTRSTTKTLSATVAGTLLAAAALLVLSVLGGASAVHGKEKTTGSVENCLALGESAMAEYFDAPHKTMMLNEDLASQFLDRIREAAPEMATPPGAVGPAAFVREDGSTVALGLFSFAGTDECGFAVVPVTVLGEWANEIAGKQI